MVDNGAPMIIPVILTVLYLLLLSNLVDKPSHYRGARDRLGGGWEQLHQLLSKEVQLLLSRFNNAVLRNRYCLGNAKFGWVYYGTRVVILEKLQLLIMMLHNYVRVHEEAKTCRVGFHLNSTNQTKTNHRGCIRMLKTPTLIFMLYLGYQFLQLFLSLHLPGTRGPMYLWRTWL